MTLKPSEREKIRMLFGGRCAYCGCELGKHWHADHVQPIMRDGKWVAVEGKAYTHEFRQTGICARPDLDCLENLYPACRPCNINKSAAPLEVWRRCLERIPDAVRRDHANYRHGERFGLIAQVANKVVFYFEKVAEEKP